MIKMKMNKKKIILIFAPILIVLLIGGLLLGKFFSKKDTSLPGSDETAEPTPYSYAKVYLADKDNVLVPLTTKYPSFENKGEEMLYVLNLLKEDSALCNETFHGLLPSATKVNTLELDNSLLKIDFDEGFKEYAPEMELKLVESIVWTMVNFEEVSGVNLYLNGTYLSNMPQKNTPLANPLTKQVGINNYLITSTPFEMGTRVLSYYEKEINQQRYYVPVTHYVENKNNLSIYDLTISTLLKDPGLTSSLQVCQCLQETTMETASILKDNVLYVSLSEDILFDELTVSRDVYNLLREVTQLLGDVKDVSFLMELEEVRVNGLGEEEVVSVSSIELNKYYI